MSTFEEWDRANPPVITHTLESALASGLVETNYPASKTMLGLGWMSKRKIHCSIRLTDGLWHYFRYSGSKGSETDKLMTGPML